MFRPISQSGRFANCAAQSANYPEISLVCKLCQPIWFHNMKVSNSSRQQSKILAVVISVNIFHGRRLPVMLVLCHKLYRISSFNTRYGMCECLLQHGANVNSTDGVSYCCQLFYPLLIMVQVGVVQNNLCLVLTYLVS